MKTSKFLMSSTQKAESLGWTTAVVEMRLSPSFGHLPVAEQERELEEAFSAAFENARQTLGDMRVQRRQLATSAA